MTNSSPNATCEQSLIAGKASSPLNSLNPTGVHLVVHVGHTGVEYHHNYSFELGTPELITADEALSRLNERIADAEVDEEYLKASPYWESNQS